MKSIQRDTEPSLQRRGAASAAPAAQASNEQSDASFDGSPRMVAQRQLMDAGFGARAMTAGAASPAKGLRTASIGALQLKNLPPDSTGALPKQGEEGLKAERELTRIELQKKLMLSLGSKGQSGFGYRLVNYWMKAPGVIVKVNPYAVEEHGMNDGSALVDSDINSQLMDVVLSTLDAAGQSEYLKDNWAAIDPTHIVLIDVDWYRERTQSDVGFHKDSRGTTLFVNLTYQNESEIQSAETQPDLEGQPQLEEKLPGEVQSDLADRRKADALTHSPEAAIPAERLGPYARLSFSDPSVWHSTPRLGHRLNENDPEPQNWDQLHTAFKRAGVTADSTKQWKEYIEAAESDSETLLRIKAGWSDVKALGDKYNGFGISDKLIPRNAEALKKTTVRRPRALSIKLRDDAQFREQIALEAAQARTFIRTWVRLIKK